MESRGRGEGIFYFSRVFPELQIFIFGIACTQRKQLPPACLEHRPVCAHPGWWGDLGWGHPAAGTCQDAGSGLYSRIHFQVITSGYSPEDRSCKVLNTLAPIQVIIYTHKERAQVGHAFLSFPWFSSDYFSRAFYSVPDENDLHSSLIRLLLRVRKRIRQEGFLSLLISKGGREKSTFFLFWDLVHCKNENAVCALLQSVLSCGWNPLNMSCMLILGNWEYNFFMCAKVRKLIILANCSECRGNNNNKIKNSSA